MRLLAFLTLISCQVHGQIIPREESNNSLVEDLVVFDENDAGSESFENYAHLLSHPLDLNKVTGEDLGVLSLLSPIQVDNLLAHREQNGRLLNLAELQSIDGFDSMLIHKISPYVIVTDPAMTIDQTLLKRIRTEGDRYIMIRYEHIVEPKKGFLEPPRDEDRFLGSEGKIAIRMRTSRPGDFSIGLTGEKDQGEAFRWNRKQRIYGFDYLSFHAQLQNKGRIRNLIIGDYQAQFGQGLIMGGAMGFGKGAETIINTRKSNIGFIPFTSSYESGALKGLASTVRIAEKIFLHTSLSLAKRDASIQPSDETSNEVSSFQYTGLHRNKNELGKRKTIEERIIGAGVHYERSRLTTGVLFQQIFFPVRVQPKESVYNQFAFRGRQNTNAGAFINYNIHNLAFFGEAAKSVERGNAFIGGVLITLSRKLDLSMVYRNFGRDYVSFYSNAFAESTTPSNEKGLYWGWKYKFNRRFNYSGYIDFFEFPWLKFRVYTPSVGMESLMRFTYQPSRTTTLFIQARQERKLRNDEPGEHVLYHGGTVTKNNFWINADYYATTALKLKTRIQFSTFHAEAIETRGFLILQDISWAIKRVKFTGRYALFETDDYDNRQYAYEHDVWLSYSLPAYHGKGTRKYILVQYKMNRHLTFWLRYSHTRYFDRDKMGSGMDMINGNQRNDIKFETRITF